MTNHPSDAVLILMIVSHKEETSQLWLNSVGSMINDHPYASLLTNVARNKSRGLAFVAVQRPLFLTITEYKQQQHLGPCFKFGRIFLQF